jgi:hypothetical protein
MASVNPHSSGGLGVCVLYAPVEYNSAAGLLHDLFGCPETGKLFSVLSAKIDVTPARLVDARTFRCPLCDAPLVIGRPGCGPVSYCASCSWSTVGTSILSIPDLLTREADPYAEATAEFVALRRLANKAALEQSRRLPSRSDTLPTNSGIDRFCAEQEEREGGIRGFDPLTLDDQTAMREHDIPPPLFVGQIDTSAVVSREKRLVSGLWNRAMQPPRRRYIQPMISIFCPLTGKLVTPVSFCESIRLAPMNAGNFMPSVRADITRPHGDVKGWLQLRLTLCNVTAMAARVTFDDATDSDISTTSHRTFRRKCEQECWLTPHGTNTLDVEACTQAATSGPDVNRFELVERVRFSPDNRSESSGKVSAHEWTCRVIVERLASPTRLDG